MIDLSSASPYFSLVASVLCISLRRLKNSLLGARDALASLMKGDEDTSAGCMSIDALSFAFIMLVYFRGGCLTGVLTGGLLVKSRDLRVMAE